MKAPVDISQMQGYPCSVKENDPFMEFSEALNTAQRLLNDVFCIARHFATGVDGFIKGDEYIVPSKSIQWPHSPPSNT